MISAVYYISCTTPILMAQSKSFNSSIFLYAPFTHPISFCCVRFSHQGILKPLMELSASLDTYRPNSAELFRSLSSANSKSELVNNDGNLLLYRYKHVLYSIPICVHDLHRLFCFFVCLLKSVFHSLIYCLFGSLYALYRLQ